ncbi:MAG TPA: FABP family protein [Euzebyales bacterium]
MTSLPGVWLGEGDGHYPTMEPFAYREELTFTRLPDKPILSYGQRTWRAGTDEPLHAECGYVRTDDDRAELVICQPTGFAEVHHAIGVDGVYAFGVTALGRTASSLAVATVRRRWELRGDTLLVDLWMSYGDVVDGHHLHAELRRT